MTKFKKYSSLLIYFYLDRNLFHLFSSKLYSVLKYISFISSLFTFFTSQMHQLQQQNVPRLTLVKSANVLRLDLNYKMSKKSQIKLLNAKIRNLKNKCKALRQQSKTDRQILSNLMNTTSELQNKTNSGMQACKQVSTQLFDNHEGQTQFSVNQNLDKMTQPTVQLPLQSNCNDQKEANIELQSVETISDYLKFQKKNEQKDSIYSFATERTMTDSMKSEGRQEDDVSLDGYLISGSQKDKQSCKKIRRANTNSYSPLKMSKVQRRQSLQQNLLIKRSGKMATPQSYNMFKSYIYAVICTAILTIIFFKIVF